VTAIVLATITAVTANVAVVAIILTFAITITAATAKVTPVVIAAATAIVARTQHLVHVKPPNGQTRSSIAPKGTSTNAILINPVSNFTPF
jgi:hypothetical protein